MQAHVELDIKAKVQLLQGVLDDSAAVAPLLRRQPGILALSEVTIMARPAPMLRALLSFPPRRLPFTCQGSV
jgi:hypothetical protein